MPESTLSLQYGDLLSAVGFYLGAGANSTRWGADQLARYDGYVQGGYRWFLNPVLLPGYTSVHRWGFLRPIGTLTTIVDVAAVLASVPTRLGELYVITATTECFTEDMDDGERYLKFTVTGNEYLIVKYVSATKVNVQGDEQTAFGYWVKGTALGTSPTSSYTTIEDTDAIFTADMIGDRLVFTVAPVSATGYVIEYVNDDLTEVRVVGDASSESGHFTVRRAATTSTLGNPTTGIITIECTASVFRDEMEGDLIVFDTTGYQYLIVEVLSTTTVKAIGYQNEIEQQTEGDTITIRTGGTATAIGSLVPVGRLTATESIFTADMVDKYVIPTDLSIPRLLITGTYFQGGEARGLWVAGDSVLGNWAGKEFGVAEEGGTLTAAEPDGIRSLITVSGITFTAAMVGRALYFPLTGNRYAIVEYDSATYENVVGDQVYVAGRPSGEALHRANAVWLVGPTTQAAGDAFTIKGAGYDYDLPADFGSIDGDLTFDPAEGWTPIPIVSERQIRVLRQQDTGTARPQMAAIRPKRSDQTKGHRFEILFWPTPDAVYNLSYRYAAIPNKLDADHPWPLGGMQHAETLLAACLAYAESKQNDGQTEKMQEYLTRLQASISLDGEATTPETLGMCTDHSDEEYPILTRSGLRALSCQNVTVKGVQY